MTPSISSVALSSSTRAIVAYDTGKRTSDNTDLFIQDLRGHVIGAPEIQHRWPALLQARDPRRLGRPRGASRDPQNVFGNSPCGKGSIAPLQPRASNRESLRSTPAVALGVADRVWALRDLLGAPLATQPIAPTEAPAKRRSRFKVIQGDLFE